MTASARILAVVRLTDDEPEFDDLAPYLRDPAAEVRVAAVNALTETTPDGFEAALVDALLDADSAVRRAAAAGLRELEEVIRVDDALGARLVEAAVVADASVREVVLGVLRALCLGTVAAYQRGLGDPVAAVRIEAVSGLVCLGEAGVLREAAADPAREVRVAVAAGLGAIGNREAAGTLGALAADAEALVRAAALEAAARLGCPPPLDALAVGALGDRAWEVRKGAATALGGAPPDIALAPLVDATIDPHLDVRKAAVRALARWVGLPTVGAALASALDDTDADVRGYARRALAAEGSPPR